MMPRAKRAYVFFIGVVAGLVALSACSGAKESRAPAKAGPLAPMVYLEEVLWWLPPDTETLMVARGPFELTSAPAMSPLERQLENTLQLFTVASLAQAYREGLPKPSLSSRILFSVAGSRNFRAPTGLGGMPFDGCEIIVLEERDAAATDKFLKSIQDRAKEKKQIGGLTIAIYERKFEQDIWTFYIARPRPNVFLAATHEGYLAEVLERMKQHTEPRALPEDLPEWRHIDRSASAWGLRHFRRVPGSKDPSSPFGGQKSANRPDEAAIGVLFSYSAAEAKVLRVRYLTGNKDPLAVARKAWPNPYEGIHPEAELIAPGVVEITTAFRDEESLGTLLFLLFGRLGYGIYL